MVIEDKPIHIPFISDIDSPKDNKGSDNVDKGTVYIRKGANTVRTEYADLQMIIRRRTEALSNIEPFEFFESEDVPTLDSAKYHRMFYNLSVRNKEGEARVRRDILPHIGKMSKIRL